VSCARLNAARTAQRAPSLPLRWPSQNAPQKSLHLGVSASWRETRDRWCELKSGPTQRRQDAKVGTPSQLPILNPREPVWASPHPGTGVLSRRWPVPQSSDRPAFSRAPAGQDAQLYGRRDACRYGSGARLACRRGRHLAARQRCQQLTPPRISKRFRWAGCPALRQAGRPMPLGFGIALLKFSTSRSPGTD
jgi:hypothetical protein